MKKTLLSILLILFLLVFAESYCLVNRVYKYKNDNLGAEINIRYFIPHSSNFIKQFWESFDEKYYNKNSSKTIAVLGCSYAEGAGLESNQNLSAQLSDYTNMSVINMGFGGHGIQSAYKFLSSSDGSFLKRKLPEINYFIYIYLEDHIRRLYDKNNIFNGELYPQYKSKNHKLKEINNSIFALLNMFYFINTINDYRMYEKYNKEINDYNLFNDIMLNLNNKTKDLYPNSQFIILAVPIKYTTKKGKSSMFPDYELKKLQKMGITVIDAETLTNSDLKDEIYYLEDKNHPNAEYWKLIIPELSKRLLLKQANLT